MREVYIGTKNSEGEIDYQQVDVADKSTEAYIFNSPIFRDFDKINGNRTATYKLPKNEKNLRIIGLANNPDVVTNFPYIKHYLSEYRDGIPFIVDGECNLLSCKGDSIEFSVTWGNINKLKEIKDLKLRNLKSLSCEEWNNNIKFLEANSEDNYGYLCIDFGKGIENKRYLHPCVNILHIINMIEEDTGLEFSYVDYDKDEEDEDKYKLLEIFKNTWIPLLETNTGEPNQKDYETTMSSSSLMNLSDYYSQFQYNYFYVLVKDIPNLPDIHEKGRVRWKKEHTLKVSGSASFYDKKPKDPEKYEAVFVCQSGIRERRDLKSTEFTPLELVDGKYTATFEYEQTYEDNDPDVWTYIGFGYRDKRGNISKFNSPVISENLTGKVIRRKPKLEFGMDYFPIVANLPDISVVDFIKSLMQMFALFTYIDEDKKTITFTSIDKMYENRDKAPDWTNLIVKNSNQRYGISYQNKDYAQQNFLKYKEDRTVKKDANGVLEVDNKTLEEKKDLFTLPYAASENISDDLDNTYAKIELYKDSDEPERITDRILYGDKYEKETGSLKVKSASFNSFLNFKGEEGLITKHYSKYNLVINRLNTIECKVYLNSIQMAQFDATVPVYIDGVYYMPIKVSIAPDGLATCELIRMPPEK